MKIISILLYVIVCLIIEGFFLWLFPHTGLGGIICWPSAILLSILSGVFIFIILGKIKPFWSRVMVFVFFICMQLYTQLSLIPQDYGGNVFEKISSAVSGYASYEEIKYTDYSSLSMGERVAFIHKYRTKLPDSFVTIHVKSHENIINTSRKYVLEKINESIDYKSSSIDILSYNDKTIITEYLSTGDTIKHSTYKGFIEKSSVGFQNDDFFVFLSEDDLELDLGIEKLLYTILNITKNR